MDSIYTPEEQRLIDVWERHLRCDFAARDAATVSTMSEDNYVNHVPGTVRQREMLNRQPEMITASFAQPRGQNLYA